MSKTRVSIPGYEGVYLEFDEAKIPRKRRDEITEAVSSGKLNAYLHACENCYYVGKFRVLTVPLEKQGYAVKDTSLGDLIFVNSKLPRAVRSSVVRELIKLREARND